MDVDTAVVSDRKGSIAVLSCSDRLEGKKLLKDASPSFEFELCKWLSGLPL